MRQLCGLLITLLFAETVAEKKYCWYFEGDYPVYFVFNRAVVKGFIQIHRGKRKRIPLLRNFPPFNGFNKSNLSQVLPYSQPLTYATGGRLCLCCRCKTYEDCCGTQCCVRALSVQRIWYFWLLLIIGILCCCSTGYFIRRRVHPYSPPEGPDFNVAFTRHPIISPGLHQTGFHNYGDSETAVISTVYPVQTHPGHVTAVYSALPSYYSQPPPSYDQVMKDSLKK